MAISLKGSHVLGFKVQEKMAIYDKNLRTWPIHLEG